MNQREVWAGVERWLGLLAIGAMLAAGCVPVGGQGGEVDADGPGGRVDGAAGDAGGSGHARDVGPLADRGAPDGIDGGEGGDASDGPAVEDAAPAVDPRDAAVDPDAGADADPGGDACPEGDCPCPEGRFACANGACVAPEHVCNTVNHCGDRSDEVGCCASDADCALRWRCVEATCERGCLFDDRCPADELCRGEVCVQACAQDWHCPMGHVCVDGGCAPGDDQCDGLDQDGDGAVDEGRVCEETHCTDDTVGPPCNGCPIGTLIPGEATSGEWVCAPPGRFVLGSPQGELGRQDLEGPQTEVVISRALVVQAHEVTRAQWRAVFGNEPWLRPACEGCPPPQVEPCDDCPADTLTWFEAAAYTNQLSVNARLWPCYVLMGCSAPPGEGMVCAGPVERAPGCTGYRLPTEAEWEYMARGGTATRFWSGDADDDVRRVGWSQWDAGARVHPVCALPEGPPFHPWGLCDVHGNVAEWTESWSTLRYPDPPEDGSPVVDPVWPREGLSWRVHRGGDYTAPPAGLRSAHRGALGQGDVSAQVGFRPVRPVGPALR
ncbi:MAG: SUMF1/EgtB/PvdO family nonheme iron enzyme [bacterium]